MAEKYRIAKFFILKRSNSYELLDLNDLAVEIAAGEVFANSLIYDEFSKEWVNICSHSAIPVNLKESLKPLDVSIQKPSFVLIEKEELTNLEMFNKNFYKSIDEIKHTSNLSNEKIDQTYHKEIEIIHYIKQISSDFSRFVDSSASASEDKNKIEQLTSKLTNALMENEILRGDLKKALLKVEILQNRINENAVNKTQDYSDDLTEVNSFEELQNGKTYEFSNDCEWLYLKDSKAQGPVRFDELLALKMSSTLFGLKIRRKSELHWRDPEEIIELTSKITVVSENSKIPEKNIYRVERGEYRAEVRQSITFEFMEIEYKGILSNISLSGGFIELFKTEEFENAIDKTGILFLNEGLVSESICCDIKIKRISKNRPKGIGFSFVNVNSKNLEILGKLITSKINSKKAA